MHVHVLTLAVVPLAWFLLISSSNLMLDAEDRLVIIDLGIAEVSETYMVY
jgi:hypothetical protein